jgi:hypothetical protein
MRLRRQRRRRVGPLWKVDVEDCTALDLSGHSRIYFGAGSLTDSFERARTPGCEVCHETGHGNFRDHDRRNAHGHETGNSL